MPEIYRQDPYLHPTFQGMHPDALPHRIDYEHEEELPLPSAADAGPMDVMEVRRPGQPTAPTPFAVNIPAADNDLRRWAYAQARAAQPRLDAAGRARRALELIAAVQSGRMSHPTRGGYAAPPPPAHGGHGPQPPAPAYPQPPAPPAPAGPPAPAYPPPYYPLPDAPRPATPRPSYPPPASAPPASAPPAPPQPSYPQPWPAAAGAEPPVPAWPAARAAQEPRPADPRDGARPGEVGPPSVAVDIYVEGDPRPLRHYYHRAYRDGGWLRLVLDNRCPGTTGFPVDHQDRPLTIAVAGHPQAYACEPAGNRLEIDHYAISSLIIESEIPVAAGA